MNKKNIIFLIYFLFVILLHNYKVFGQNWDEPDCLSQDDATWQSIGPYPHSNNIMGLISAIWMDPQDHNFVLAGTRADGVWRTKNGGNDWTCVTEAQRLPVIGITSIAISPNKNNNNRVIYASTGYSDRHPGLGIIKSEDDGDTWSIIEFFPPHNLNNTSSYVTDNLRVAQHTTQGNPDVLIASVGSTLYKSTNGGSNWSSQNFNSNIDDIQFFPDDIFNNKIIVTLNSYDANRAEIWYSGNQGTSWTEIGQNFLSLLDSDFINQISVCITNDIIYTIVCQVHNGHLD